MTGEEHPDWFGESESPVAQLGQAEPDPSDGTDETWFEELDRLTTPPGAPPDRDHEPYRATDPADDTDGMAVTDPREATDGDTATGEDAVDGIYQLCDPSPPTVRGLVDICGSALGRRTIGVPVHARFTGRALDAVPGLANRLGLEPASLDYLAHPTSYVCPNTRRALAGTGIACPPLASYVGELVTFMRANPSMRTSAMQ